MSMSWFLIRGSGIVAYVMLAAAVIWGLLVSSKAMGAAVKAKGLSWFHESLGLAAVLATGVHMFALTLDEYVTFGPRELFIPGASEWQPLAVAFGVVSFYAVAVVAFSFYVKRWIGQSVWRAIHFLSFGTFAAATTHGIMAGTDSESPYMLALYWGAIVLVAFLVIIRIVGTRAASSARPARAPLRAVPAAEGSDQAAGVSRIAG